MSKLPFLDYDAVIFYFTVGSIARVRQVLLRAEPEPCKGGSRCRIGRNGDVQFGRSPRQGNIIEDMFTRIIPVTIDIIIEPCI